MKRLFSIFSIAVILALLVGWSGAPTGAQAAAPKMAVKDSSLPQPSFSILPATAGAVIEVWGNGVKITNGDLIPSVNDDTFFDSVYVAGTAYKSHTFTIKNTVGVGGANLNLSGSPKVTISGTNAADFSVTTIPTSPVAPGASTTFTVKFKPSAFGARAAMISIANSSSVSPFTFAVRGKGLAPEIKITGSSHIISDGDMTPSTLDGTDFGDLNISGIQSDHTFTIYNIGTSDLILHGTPKVIISGATSSDFKVITQPAATIAAGGSTTFTIRFNSSAVGVKFAGVSIPNNDADEHIYNFRLTGRGTDPEINVKGGGFSIADGDTTPSVKDDTDFGAMNVVGAMAEHTFTIYNVGTGSLALTSTPKVNIFGAAAADFSVITQPTSPVAPGSTTTFTIRFNPSAAGKRLAKVVIANDDTSEHSYDFMIQGEGKEEHIINHGFNIYPGLYTAPGYSNVPLFWTSTRLGSGDGKDTIYYHDGTASFRFAGEYGQSKAILQEIKNFTGSSGHTFIFSFWIKGAAVPPAGECRGHVYVYNGHVLNQMKFIECPTGTYDFQKETLIFDASTAFTSVVVKFSYIKPLGTIWIDDASLLY